MEKMMDYAELGKAFRTAALDAAPKTLGGANISQMVHESSSTMMFPYNEQARQGELAAETVARTLNAIAAVFEKLATP